MNGENPRVRVYVVYQWDCDCSNVNEEDHDPAGEIVTCSDCGRQSIAGDVG